MISTILKLWPALQLLPLLLMTEINRNLNGHVTHDVVREIGPF